MDRARREFEIIMKISAEPVLAAKRFWSKAIPQYNLGYVEHENFFDHFEKNNKGIMLGGNYAEGFRLEIV